MKAAVLALVALPVLPCIRDTDTPGSELRGLPGAGALLVTGRLPFHGKAGHEERVRRIPPALEARPEDLAACDDLAVAWERLGDHERALAVLDRKAAALRERPDPGQEYRMLANRGTFLARAGRFDEAIPVLEGAVALEPRAHFGRERYPIDHYRCLAAAGKDPTLWEREDFLSFARVWPKDGGYGAAGRLSFSGAEELHGLALQGARPGPPGSSCPSRRRSSPGPP
jgi:tetratricopeptide (TPR) repeat protein